MNIFRKELIYALILLLGSMSWGLTMSYWSPCKISMTNSLKYSDIVGTLFNFLAPFACIFGGSIVNLFVDKLGRNLTIFIASVIMFFSWFAMSYTKSNFKYLALITRFLLGFVIGSFSTIIPNYISDLLQDDASGISIILHQFGISFGVLVCYIMGIWLKWRKLTLINAIPAGLLSVLIWLVPESSVVPRQPQQENSIKESVFQKKYTSQLLISIALMFFQQFAGTPAFLANLNDIFNNSKINIDSSIASFIVGLVGVIAVLFTYFLFRFCCRKLVWHISSIGQLIVLSLCACNIKWNWSPILPIVLLVFDILLFSIGSAPIPWCFLNELFDDSVRSSAISVITAVNWCFGSILFLLWDAFVYAIGLTWSFAILAIIMALCFIFGIFALPKIQSVEDTQNNFSEKSNSKKGVHSKLLDQMSI